MVKKLAKIDIRPLAELDPARFEIPAILKQLTNATRQLAELKGVVASIPNQQILISALGLQEAKDSSEIENIVTTHDELFRDAASQQGPGSPAAKEVLRYRQALNTGFKLVKKQKVLTTNHILRIQAQLEMNDAGFRKVPGTTLKNPATNEVIYTPPQEAPEIERLMAELEAFLNADPAYAADPLIRMALIHHQFESIHPFYDGNGRTGRILNVLYLVKEGLLDIPVLYMSRHIVRTKQEYYRLLQAVRDEDAWEQWVLYMLTAVEITAREGILAVEAIRDALIEVKHLVRRDYKFYSQDLINHLFSHPYSMIEYARQELGVSRITATRYLNELAAGGVLRKVRWGRTYFYVNTRLVDILAAGA